MATGQGQGGQQGGMNLMMAGMPQGGIASLMGGMPPGMGGPMPQQSGMMGGQQAAQQAMQQFGQQQGGMVGQMPQGGPQQTPGFSGPKPSPAMMGGPGMGRPISPRVPSTMQRGLPQGLASMFGGRR